MKEILLNRFLTYVRRDTTADSESTSYPSTSSQRVFNELLADELIGIGLQEVYIDDHSLLTATIPATPGYEELPVIGFIAHVDTSPDVTGLNVKPLVHENYDGSNITLPSGHVLSQNDFPELKHFIGHTLITSSGDTLLGADDKAGVAEIVTAAQHLINTPSLPHGKIRLAFTCDEEIGRGTDFFPIKTFGADFAYTLDSGAIALLEYENFNACAAKITISGRNIHPGYAYQRMINALELAFEFHSHLPASSKPELTRDRDGFFHLTDINGTVEQASLHYIIREFDDSKLAEMRSLITSTAAEINSRYDYEPISVSITEQYRNMRTVLDSFPEVVDRARAAIKSLGLTPIEHPIRGGTDGARLSELGLPCPNIFTGGMNFHSRLEYATLDGMELAVKAILAIATAQ